MLNGTVMVDSLTTNAGTLTITGDSHNNIITVRQVGKNVDGAPIIQVTGAATKLSNLDTGKTGTSFKFGSATGDDISAIDIEMGGGSDIVTFTDTTVFGSITVNMDDPSSGGVGDGNDVLVMSNVHSTDDNVNVWLGGGTNVASLTKVSAVDGFSLDAGNGRNVVVLNGVSAGSGEEFFVDLGTGKLNTVTVIHCSGGDSDFFDDGSNGVLVGVGNHFDSISDVASFKIRVGDLKHDTGGTG